MALAVSARKHPYKTQNREKMKIKHIVVTLFRYGLVRYIHLSIAGKFDQRIKWKALAHEF